MKWLEVSAHTCPEGIDHVAAKLLTLGISGVELEDEDDFTDFLEQNKRYWDYVDEKLRSSKRGVCRVKFYVTDDEAGRAQLSAVRHGLDELKSVADTGLGSLDVSLKGMDEEDWANAWKRWYKPIPVGSRVLIRPEWEPLTEPTDRVIFVNDPGMSFGTGDHESTRLCIEALERNIAGGAEVLDLGCGSGILFIIALLLGAAQATAVDIDPNASNTVARNAALNAVGNERYRLFTGDITEDFSLLERISDRKYDVITANIVSDVIVSIAPLIKNLLKTGGAFIASGIISERRSEVTDALAANGLTIRGMYEERGWCCLECGL